MPESHLAPLPGAKVNIDHRADRFQYLLDYIFELTAGLAGSACAETVVLELPGIERGRFTQRPLCRENVLGMKSSPGYR